MDKNGSSRARSEIECLSMSLLKHPEGGVVVERKSPAQLFGMIVGSVLVIAGVLGFFYNSDFQVGEATLLATNRGEVIGLFEVNGWHNLVHILTGAIGLLAA